MQRLFYIFSIFLLQYLIKIDATKPAHHDNLLQMTQDSIEGCYEDDAHTVPVEITDGKKEVFPAYALFKDGFDALLRGSRDPPRNGKCLRYCIMRKKNLFTEENIVNVNEFLQFFGKLYNNTVDEILLKEVIVECNEDATKEKDRCERAHITAMCILGNLGAKGVEGL